MVLTKNIPVACPGEILTFTCVSESYVQRWRIHPSSVDTSKILAEIGYVSNDVPGISVIVDNPQYQFNFTLISSNYINFTSVLMIVASEQKQNLFIECASPLSFSTNSVRIAGN